VTFDSKINRWNNWILTLNACHRQVERALAITEPEEAGECGLAIVATATMLEAYVNFHITEEYYGDRLIAEPLIEPIRNMSAAQRYRLLPRLAGRSADVLARYEALPIHATIGEVFTRRNRFVHGNLDKWEPSSVTPAEVARLWNAALEALIALETVGEFRIPPSRFEDYADEVHALRVAAPR